MKVSNKLGAVLVAAFTASGTAWGDASLTPPGPVPSSIGTAEEARAAQPAADAAFGLNQQDYWLGATQFHPRSGDDLNYSTFYYWYAATGTGTRQFEAQVNLPAGARVSDLECFFNDTNAAADATVGFWKHSYDYITDQPAVSNITTVSSSGSAGYQKPFQSINETIRLRDGNDRNIYTLILGTPGSSTAVSFRGCRFFWNRQITPAPATASFSDVPTSHPFFQFIEAIASAGVTSGCNATQYCPDAPVLRSQMAAFLARMGGLHWPY